MAVTNEYSAEFQAAVNATPTQRVDVNKWGGKLRARYFKHTQGAAAGDINSTAELVRLPAGKVRIIGHLSRIEFSAFGAARTLDVGNRAYTKQDGTTQAESAAFYASAVDVAAAGNLILNEAQAAGTHANLLVESKTGFDIFAKVAGGTWPAGAVTEGTIVYVLD